MTVVPGQKGTAGVEEVPDPDTQDAALLVRGMMLGVCGTDREIAEGAYGTPPSCEERLIIGHESLGEVLEAPAGSGFAPGDLVAGIVRRPDPVPCPACAVGEWDMCRTDSFAERGIVRLHGYGSERWRVEPDFAVPIPSGLGELGVLLEPASGIMNLSPTLDVDATTLNRNMVLRNQVLFGTVNAGRRHWEQAAQALATADPSWLRRLITRRVPLTSWTEALDRHPEDIKVIVDLTA